MTLRHDFDNPSNQLSPKTDPREPEIASGRDSPLGRRIPSYVLKHQGEQVRFEASQ